MACGQGVRHPAGRGSRRGRFFGRKLAPRLRDGLALRRRRQLRDAALGPASVPGGGCSGTPIAGRTLRGTRLRVVPRTARSPAGTETLVRLRGLPPGAVNRRWWLHAGRDRADGDVGVPRPRHSPDRGRQIALLPSPRAVPLRQDGRPHRGDLPVGGADGGPGGGVGGTGHRLLRHGQRDAVHAGTVGRSRPGPLGGRGHRADFPRTTAQPFPAARPCATGDRHVGAGRSPLPIALGPRFPAGLSLRRALCPGTGRRWAGPAVDVPHRHGEAGRDSRDRRLLSGRVGYRVRGVQRRRAAGEPLVSRRRHGTGAQARRHSRIPDGGTAAGRPGRGHRLLRHPPRVRGGRRVPRAQGHRRRVLSRRLAAGDEEGHPAALYRGIVAGHCRNQRLRHGHRQAGRASRHSRRHSGLARELSTGGRAGLAGIGRRPDACCSTRRKTSNGSSACPRGPGSAAGRFTASCVRLRNLDRKGRLGGEVVATPGEILLEDDEQAFERDSATDDTRVKTAVAWLEGTRPCSPERRTRCRCSPRRCASPRWTRRAVGSRLAVASRRTAATRCWRSSRPSSTRIPTRAFPRTS